ncbi:hypothetical protein E2C01_085838 [Portunus trituberculatus]|uniref:Uncharacterized protein n=1 Tax=Portunus trituberculatus TaxID=210409 RepID=A0A5B7J836_PORTR|nr:hypothetical protein [Portunus trituberculatus]
MGEITTSTIPQWTYTHVRERRLQTLLARLRIGHTYLTQRYLLTRDPQHYCDDCLGPLTVRHLLVECASLTDLRHRYLYRCRSRDSGVYYISKILGLECLAQGYDVFFLFLGDGWMDFKKGAATAKVICRRFINLKCLKTVKNNRVV